MRPDLLVSVFQAILWLGVAALFWRMPDLQARGLAFGVRIPPERAGDPAVVAVRQRYRRGVAASVALAAAGWLAVLGTGWGGAAGQALAASGAGLGFLLLATLAYVAAHRRLAAVKAQEGWLAASPRAAVAETRPRGAGEIRWAWFAPALAVLLATLALGLWVYPHLPARIPMHIDAAGRVDAWATKSYGSALMPVWVQLFLTLVVGGVAALVPSAPLRLDPGEPEESLRRQLLFRRRMVAALGVVAAGADLTALLLGLVVWGWLPPSYAALSVLPTLLAVLVMLGVTLSLGQEGSRLRPTRRPPSAEGRGATAPAPAPAPIHAPAPADDDRYWWGGLVYVNRDDPSFLVSKRFGVGWTVNFGHPLGWLFAALVLGSIAVAVALPLLAGR